MQRPFATVALAVSAVLAGVGASVPASLAQAPAEPSPGLVALVPQDADVTPFVRISARLARTTTSGTLLSVPVDVDANAPARVCQHTQLLVVDAPGTERTRHRACWDVPAGADGWRSVIRLRVPHDQRGRTRITWVAEAAGRRVVVRRAVMVRGRSITIA